MNVQFRRARSADMPRLQAIRHAAFAPVFASFRSILGAELYDLAQARKDQAQEAFLEWLMLADSGWALYVARSAETTVGFVSLRLDRETREGEIGLNAVDPAHANKGIGTAMYEFAVTTMKTAGIESRHGEHWGRSEPWTGPSRLPEGRVRHRDAQRLVVSHAVIPDWFASNRPATSVRA